MRGLKGLVGAAALLTVASTSAVANAAHVCWPSVTIPAVTIPAVTIPAVTIPGVTIPAVTLPRTCFAGTCYPAQHYPAQHYPAQHYPAQHYPAQHYPARRIAGGCYTAPLAFAPAHTTVRVSGYNTIDPSYAPALTSRYWRTAGAPASYPDPTAPGFGQFNAAGFPKNQYVRPYVRSDGTMVSGYWRNSPSDGLPTCKIINC